MVGRRIWSGSDRLPEEYFSAGSTLQEELCTLGPRCRKAAWLGERMINVFVLQNGRLNQVNIESRSDLENATPIWVDLTSPTEEERAWVKSIYGVALPDEDEVKDIEASARYYEAESGDLNLRYDFLLEDDVEPTHEKTKTNKQTKNMLFS